MSTGLTIFLLIWIGAGVGTAFLLLRVAAPYGRHGRTGWGPTLPHRIGWIVMETVSPVALLWSFLSTAEDPSGATWLLVALWVGHYVYRALIYPFRARWRARRMPGLIALSAVGFNAVNGTVNGLALGSVGPEGFGVLYFLGLALWVAGLAVNIHSDGVLLRLRRPGDTDYSVPRDGLYQWVSCPNYLGEIVEWIGFAVAAWNLAALSFAIWTIANLLPRALAHHRWYHEQFPEYPAHRRALIPGVL